MRSDVTDLIKSVSMRMIANEDYTGAPSGDARIGENARYPLNLEMNWELVGSHEGHHRTSLSDNVELCLERQLRRGGGFREAMPEV